MPLQRYEIEQCSGLFHFRLGISLVMLTDRNLDERNEAIPYKMQPGSKLRRRSRRELFTLKLCYRYNVLLFFSCYGLFNLIYLSSSRTLSIATHTTKVFSSQQAKKQIPPMRDLPVFRRVIHPSHSLSLASRKSAWNCL